MRVTAHVAGASARLRGNAIRDSEGGWTKVSKLLRGPLMILIPLMALTMAVSIGISIGLIFIQTHNSFNENVTLIVAVAMTATIMAIAGFLSYTDYKNPRQEETAATRPAGGPRKESQAGPRAPVTERPARGKSRSDGRRKSR